MKPLSMLLGLTILMTLYYCKPYESEIRDKELPLGLLHQSEKCTSPAKVFKLIETEAQLNDVAAKVFNITTSSLLVDMEAQSALLISMGYQPNTGYQLALLSEQARLTGDTLQIDVAWNTPAPDMMYAQVITNPCLLIAVPKENYRRIQILDQFGTPIGTVMR